jgi:hypothetical protein
MKGGIGIENFTSDQTIDLSAYGLSNLTITSPELFFQWKALVLEGKLQLSKDLSIITLMMGAGISYAVYAEAGGGLRSEVLYGGVPITEEDIENIKSILGPDAPELNKKSITVLSEVKGWSIRVFGGLTINIFFFKIDFNVMYNFMTKGFGASLNMRFQFSPREKKEEKKEEEKKEE